jgi:hypothetical protein
MAVEPQAARAMASFTRDGTHGTFTTEERICSLMRAISSIKRYTREATLKFGLYMHKVYIKFYVKSMAGAGMMVRSTTYIIYPIIEHIMQAVRIQLTVHTKHIGNTFGPKGLSIGPNLIPQK